MIDIRGGEGFMGSSSSGSKTWGVIYGMLAFLAWGLLPVYWKLLNGMPAYEILAHRIFWSFIFVGAILLFSKRLGKIKEAFKDRRSIVFIVLSSILIGINWFVYIWAVNANHIVESSMGYYINPLMSILLGTLVLKEKLNLWQYVALAFAALGVLSITIQYGSIPWVALVLAITFALYGLCKKMINVDSAVGLALETLMLVPFSFAFLVFIQVQGTAAFLNSTLPVTLLLICSGIATATPLLWFAKGAKRVELSTIGFLQYISPSISLTLGIIVFKEQFSAAHMISFSFIWAGLAIYSISQLGIFKRFTLRGGKTYEI